MSAVNACVVMTTVPNEEQAERIARAVLEASAAYLKFLHHKRRIRFRNFK